MNEDQETNLRTAWMMAFNSMGQPWILESLELYKINRTKENLHQELNGVVEDNFKCKELAKSGAYVKVMPYPPCYSTLI